ncbi:MAG: metal ABC transporter substrate-binding protein [Candidatus Bathyarchaeia archaeon]|jgi:zinc transport system substrate-binding protein
MNSKQKILIATIVLIGIVAIAAVALTSFTPKTDKLTIVATFYPLAYMSEKIGGDYVSVTQLVPDNTEIHSWEPSASDIVATDDARIIVYNGGGADNWMKNDILPSLSTSEDRIVVEATQDLTLIANQDNDEGEEHGQYDPHTWISPYMAKQEGEKIYNALIQADPANKDYYTQNWQTLKNELTEIDAEYSQSLQNARVSEIFVSHEAYGYLADRYGFQQHGVIGLSADEQPNAATIATLVDEMKQHSIYVVYVDPVYSTAYAETIKSEVEEQTGHSVTILKLYLMLGPQGDLDYLQQMQTNIANLKVGLDAT